MEKNLVIETYKKQIAAFKAIGIVPSSDTFVAIFTSLLTIMEIQHTEIESLKDQVSTLSSSYVRNNARF